MRGVDHLEGSRLPLAIHALERSVALDPGFSWGWTEMGAAYIANAAVRFGGGEMYGKAQAAFNRAISLSPSDPRPGIVHSDMLIETNRVEEAVPLLREIVKQNPRHAGAVWQLGYAYRYAGMLEESAQAGQTAYDVDPGFAAIDGLQHLAVHRGIHAIQGLDSAAFGLGLHPVLSRIRGVPLGSLRRCRHRLRRGVRAG